MAASSDEAKPLSPIGKRLTDLSRADKAEGVEIMSEPAARDSPGLDARRPEHGRPPEDEEMQRMLLQQASQGLADVAAGRVKDARRALSAYQRRRAP